MISYVKWLLAISISLTFGLYATQAGITSLESSLAGATGAIVGGVIAALAFIFNLLINILKKSVDQPKLFEPLSKSLKYDVMILIWALCFSIFLPIARHTDFPFLIYPLELSEYFSKNQLITTLEVFIVLVAISVLFEICDAMFRILIASTLDKE